MRALDPAIGVAVAALPFGSTSSGRSLPPSTASGKAIPALATSGFCAFVDGVFGSTNCSVVAAAIDDAADTSVNASDSAAAAGCGHFLDIPFIPLPLDGVPRTCADGAIEQYS